MCSDCDFKALWKSIFPSVPRFIEPKQCASLSGNEREFAQMVERSLGIREVEGMTPLFSILEAFGASFVRLSPPYATCRGSPLQKKVFVLIPVHMFSHKKPS
ncbi:MAG: hypothetical protein ACRC9V_02315, partial [Aeromonas sp.]